MKLTMATMTIILLMILEAQGDVILKTNYGYSLETWKPKVFLTTDNARIILHLTVPHVTVGEMTPEQLAEEQNDTRNPCLGIDLPRTPLDRVYPPRCGNILTLVEKRFELRQSARFLIQSRQREINALIEDIAQAPRQKRGVGSVIGAGLTWGFDLATASDVDQSLLRQVLDFTNKALSAWTVGQNLITRITKLTSQRFNKTDELLHLTRISIVDENRRLQNLRIEDYTAQRLIPVVVEELGDLKGQMHEIESFYLALKDLAWGRLSHNLIETDVLQDNLDILAETIKTHNTQAKLVYPYVHHRLNDSSSHVLTATSHFYGKAKNSTPTESKPLI